MELIDKSAVVAEIEERRDSLISLSESCPANTVAKSGFYAQAQTLEGIKNFIDQLEVKEVDLEKEIKRFTMSKELYEADSVIKAVAEHFFELGLKAQKGE